MTERERLTTERRKIFARESVTLMSMPKDELRQHYNEIFDRLQEYEVDEENGLLIRLPCKFNDDLWWIDDDNTVRCQERAIKTICCHENGTFSIIDTDGNEDKIGTRYAYLTREEAEKALEDMKGGAD